METIEISKNENRKPFDDIHNGKIKNLQNFHHHWNQHKKLSIGFYFLSDPICNSRGIGHVPFFGHQRF